VVAQEATVERDQWIDQRRRGREGEWAFDDSQKVRIWDTVEERWTELLPQDVAQQLYLRQVGLKCSTCNFVDSQDGKVAKHIQQVVTGVAEHRGATLMSFTEGEHSGTTCSACGGRFLLRKQQGEQHLARFNDGMLRAHEGAEEVRIRRYTLEPPVLTVEQQSATVGPEVNQEQRRLRSPTGRRRRGHRGGRRHR
jgi:hypothetical protein